MEEKLLALSTAHMPSTNPDFGEMRAIKFAEGYIVWPSEPGYGIPEWIAPIIDLASRSDCTLILFDCDLNENPELPMWEWWL